jgi:hypothetical protein
MNLPSFMDEGCAELIGMGGERSERCALWTELMVMMTLGSLAGDE